jgi:thiol-disulfide isomerase/thioredoxin
MRISPAFAILLALPLSALAAFSDVPATYRYSDAIMDIQKAGIVEGYPPTISGQARLFKPDASINRAEFTKIVTLAAFGTVALNSERFFDTPGFPDVPEGAWFYRYILFAWQHGIISGHPDGTFRPEATINFAEASKIIVKSFRVPHREDVGTWWWEGYIAGLSAAGALPPTFRTADQLVTRGEMAFMIAAALEGIDDPDASCAAVLCPVNSMCRLGECIPVAPPVCGDGICDVRERCTSPCTNDYCLDSCGAYYCHDDCGGNQKRCVKGGCSGQLCVEEGSDDVTTCEWRSEYACYASARCERQSSGQCGWTQTLELQACLNNGGPIPTELHGAYTEYRAGVVGSGEEVVLFFHASWCPYCQANDARLNAWHADGTLPLDVYKIDYDTAVALKSTYGVTTQDTFIRFDREGREVGRISFASEEALRGFLD